MSFLTAIERVAIPCNFGSVFLPLAITVKTVTIPETVYNDSMYNGGVSLLSTNELGLVVTQDDYAFSKLTIRYLAVDLDDIKKHDDLEVIGLLQELSIMNNGTLKPKFE